jgi:cell division protein FtsB
VERLGVYVPTRRKRTKTADLSELRAAADRLSQALADLDEEDMVDEFNKLRRRGKDTSR